MTSRISDPSRRAGFQHRLTALAVTAIVSIASGRHTAAQTAADADAITPFITQYCIDCHDQGEPEGSLSLHGLDPTLARSAPRNWDTTTWEKVLKRLRTRQMPPADAARPEEAEYAAAIASLEALLDQFAARFPNPGRTESLRRLSRTEYQNTVRDLLALEVDVDQWIPADPPSHGFDNVTVGDLSATSLNRYITAAENICRIAIGSPQRSAGGITIRLPPDRTQESHVDGLPLGTRGGTVIRQHFSQTGEYEIQLRLSRDRDEMIEGLTEPHRIDVLVDRALVHQFDLVPPSGNDHSLVDANLKARIRVTAGSHAVAVTFPKTSASLLEQKRQPFDAAYNRHRHPRRTPAIHEISIAGPFFAQGPGQTASRAAIFGDDYPATGQEDVAAEKILRRLLRRAYRRPIADADLASPLQFYREGFVRDGFEAGIEAALASILVNPNFLFRIEQDPLDAAPGQAYALSDVELASRLSYFLWSSSPDDELLGLAEAGKLNQPDELAEQARRLLGDPRSHSLVTNFASQWLYLRNLDAISPDLRLFPNFDDNLRDAFRRESELSFAAIVNEDRSIVDLLDGSRTFLNERLAKHYDIPHIFGSHFREVDLDVDHHRGGLLRQGSVLTVTSYATRTSPTVRGHWILQNILGTPPPPPPPGIPALKEKSEASDASVRARLAEHRANPACASCHDLMDPIGFALDQFDAVGRWRDFEDGLPIDVSGTLPDGTDIHGVDDLESALVERPEVFVGTAVEKLMTFALGRGIEASDGPAVRRIVRDAKQADYRFSSLIAGIVASEPFRMKLARSQETTQ